jgi:hypothetical protein
MAKEEALNPAYKQSSLRNAAIFISQSLKPIFNFEFKEFDVLKATGEMYHHLSDQLDVLIPRFFVEYYRRIGVSHRKLD